MRTRAGQDSHLANLTQFMDEGAKALGLEFGEEEREDVARIQDPVLLHDSGHWSGGLEESFRKLPSHWSPTIGVDHTGAILTVRLEPDTWIEGPHYLPVSKHICIVTDPSGNVSYAFRDTSACVIDFRFPDDFQEVVELAPGKHTHRWFRTQEDASEVPWVPFGEVLSGTFEIPAT